MTKHRLMRTAERLTVEIRVAVAERNMVEELRLRNERRKVHNEMAKHRGE